MVNAYVHVELFNLKRLVVPQTIGLPMKMTAMIERRNVDFKQCCMIFPTCKGTIGKDDTPNQCPARNQNVSLAEGKQPNTICRSITIFQAVAMHLA